MILLNETLKYYKCYFDNLVFYIEISCDYSVGKTFYAAKTSLLFKDDEGYVPCAGVGDTEDKALNNCNKEFFDAVSINKGIIQKKNLIKMEKVEMPLKVSALIAGERSVFLYKMANEKILLLTNRNLVKTNALDLNRITLEDEKQLVAGTDYFPKEYLIKNNFFPVFSSLYQIYER